VASADFHEKVLQLKVRFDSRRETLAIAESCTGGLLSSFITAVSGVSSFYLGAVVSYHRQVKNSVLGVPMSMIQAQGEVSVAVAQAMAEGARRAMGSQWAVAITGIAGPGGGSAEKPVGMVCFGLVGPGVNLAETQYFSPQASRRTIQQAAAEFALDLLLKS
jgi:nicotinamide-nucleotide amidase